MLLADDNLIVREGARALLENDPTIEVPLGHGLTNMRDHLGALIRRLTVESTSGVGTSVRASIPARPIENAEARPGHRVPAGPRT